MKKIYISDPIKKKRLVGTLSKSINGKTIFRKVVTRKRHYMKVVKGYGIQKDVYDKYLRGKGGVIQIKERDTGKFLVASIDTWQKHSRAGNYGDGKQIFLSEKYMHNADNFDRKTIKEELPSRKEYIKNMLRLKKIWDATVAANE